MPWWASTTVSYRVWAAPPRSHPVRPGPTRSDSDGGAQWTQWMFRQGFGVFQWQHLRVPWKVACLSWGLVCLVCRWTFFKHWFLQVSSAEIIYQITSANFSVCWLKWCLIGWISWIYRTPRVFSFDIPESSGHKDTVTALSVQWKLKRAISGAMAWRTALKPVGLQWNFVCDWFLYPLIVNQYVLASSDSMRYFVELSWRLGRSHRQNLRFPGQICTTLEHPKIWMHQAALILIHSDSSCAETINGEH